MPQCTCTNQDCHELDKRCPDPVCEDCEGPLCEECEDCFICGPVSR